ncbi:hypothetical protein ACOSQ3_021287 [Xanthoceras sorbifolium]
METAELADDRVCNAMVKARHDLMIQYKASQMDEWKVNKWIADYKELIGEVDVEKTPPTELSSQKDLAMEVEHADDVERLEASLVDPGVIIGLTTPNST